jgi:hypothetical protein
MKRIIVLTLLNILTLLSFAQVGDDKVIKLFIKYQSCFAMLPEIYEIDLNDKIILSVSPIIDLPGNTQKRKSKKLGKKKWERLSYLIDKTDFKSIDSSTAQGIDGAWYYIDIESTDKELKKIKIWSGYAPTSLIDLHNLLKNYLK